MMSIIGIIAAGVFVGVMLAVWVSDLIEVANKRKKEAAELERKRYELVKIMLRRGSYPGDVVRIADRVLADIKDNPLSSKKK